MQKRIDSTNNQTFTHQATKADETIANFKITLKNEFNMSRKWIENTVQWLTKKADKKGTEKKKALKRKFHQLQEEKLLFEKELNEFIMRKEAETPKIDKKVVYNNSSKQLTEKQISLLALGLNFAIAPRKFPLVEYITATEKLCQTIEKAEDESVEKA